MQGKWQPWEICGFGARKFGKNCQKLRMLSKHTGWVTTVGKLLFWAQKMQKKLLKMVKKYRGLVSMQTEWQPWENWGFGAQNFRKFWKKKPKTGRMEVLSQHAWNWQLWESCGSGLRKIRKNPKKLPKIVKNYGMLSKQGNWVTIVGKYWFWCSKIQEKSEKITKNSKKMMGCLVSK